MTPAAKLRAVSLSRSRRRSPSAAGAHALESVMEGMGEMQAVAAQDRAAQQHVNNVLAQTLGTLNESVVVMQRQLAVVHAAGAQVAPSPAAMAARVPERGPDGHRAGDALAPRGPAPTGPAHRMVGGAARLAHRLSVQGREGGELEDEELAEFAAGMELGAKVTPRTRARFLKGTRSHAGSVVTDMLMNEGLLDGSGGHGVRGLAREDFLDSMGQVLAEKTVVRRKVASKPFPSFNKLFLKYSEMGFFSRVFFESDTREFWAMDWHFKCLTWMDRKYGWKIAGEYHARVMSRWNRFDRDAYADSVDTRAGDWEQACQRDIFFSVLTDPDLKTAARPRAAAGSVEQVEDDDAFCEHHKRWFSRSDNHNSHTCRMSSAVKAKAKKEEKKDKG